MKKMLLLFMCLACLCGACFAHGGEGDVLVAAAGESIGIFVNAGLGIWGLSLGTTFPVVAGSIFAIRAISGICNFIF